MLTSLSTTVPSWSSITIVSAIGDSASNMFISVKKQINFVDIGPWQITRYLHCEIKMALDLWIYMYSDFMQRYV